MKEAKNYLENKLKENDTIVLGLSGGPDSMCLFSLLLELKNQFNLNIICAHVNHNVRSESEEEAEFVKKVVEENKCIFEYYKIESYESENFESNARKKRYKFYNELIEKYNANYLMTAHHGDDLTETIMMRLVRGSNLSGYGGFKKETNCDSYQLLRPLIYTTKEEIEKYMSDNNIEYRVDKTNQDIKYTRNRYRKKILPLLKNENKNVHKKFLKFSEELYMIEEFLVKETENALTKVFVFDKLNLDEFNKLDSLLKKRVIEYILKSEYQNDINLITERHLQKILDICHSKKANAYLNLPMKKTIVKSYGTLYFEKEMKKKQEDIILDEVVILNTNQKIIKVTSSDIKKSNYILRLNSNEIELPLHIRYRKNSDTMTIKNLNGSKKLKDIFINEKIELSKRDTWPIVVDNKDTILWIPGVKKSNFDKNIDESYDIIYKYVISEEN